MNQMQEEFYQVMTRLRGSKAASSLPEPREWYLDKNGTIVSKPIESKAASAVVTPQGINKVKEIANFINARNY